MGAYLSRNTNGIEEIRGQSVSPYTFPPLSGPYFADHYFMGGKKFETSQPESYLFGDNSDLNFLGPYPNEFPYRSPQANQPIRALKCLVNIRKDSLRLLRAPTQPNKPDNIISTTDDTTVSIEAIQQYNIEFTFDADCPCSIRVYYNASEKLVNNAVVFTPGSPKECSDVVFYNAGCNQQFCLPAHNICPSTLVGSNDPPTPNKWNFHRIPVAIQVSAECEEVSGHSHITYAVFEKTSDGHWSIKILKQKQVINGVCYLLQEIYGIENKTKAQAEAGDASVSEDNQDNNDGEPDNAECVVCLSDMRDTLILPCKHLCLCSGCANQLRFQQSGCPICRQSFRALLQIRAVRRKSAATSNHDSEVSAEDSGDEDDDEERFEAAPVPDGYEVVPLIDAINGPVKSAATVIVTTTGKRGGGGGGVTTTTVQQSNAPPRKSSSRKKKKSTLEIEHELTTTTASSDSATAGDGNSTGGRRGRQRAAGDKRQRGGSKKQTAEVAAEDDDDEEDVRPPSKQAAATPTAIEVDSEVAMAAVEEYLQQSSPPELDDDEEVTEATGSDVDQTPPGSDKLQLSPSAAVAGAEVEEGGDAPAAYEVEEANSPGNPEIFQPTECETSSSSNASSTKELLANKRDDSYVIVVGDDVKSGHDLTEV